MSRTRRDRFQQAIAIFEALCDAPPASWPAALASRCRGAPHLADVVGEMLAADQRSLTMRGLVEAPKTPTRAMNIHLQAPLGSFILQHPLGIGGMGEVWQGVHRERRTPVAIKLLLREHARQPVSLDAFRAEVRAIAALSHPYIVQIFDYGVLPGETADAAAAAGVVLVPGTPWLAMELASGGPLSSWVRQPVAWPALSSALHQLLSALSHAHARGILHRDIKPANVLMCAETDLRPGLKLADFGIAHSRQSRSSPSTAGTLGFMAPEQFAGRWRDLGPWTDLFSLGVMASTLLHGRLPAPSEPDDPPRMPVPDGLGAWVRKMMAADPADRFSNAAAAKQALGALEGIPTDTGWRSPVSSRPMLLPADIGLGLVGLREGPLLGREAEQEALWDLLGADAASVVIIRGLSGVGKSRMAAWLCQRAREVGRAVARSAHATPEPAAVSPLGQMLLHSTGCQELSEEDATERLRRQGASEADAVALLAMMRLTSVPSPRRQRLQAVLRYFQRLSSGPCILWLEDAQWNLEMLQLARAAIRADFSLLVILTAKEEALSDRPEIARALAGLCRRADVHKIPLGPLPAPLWGELVSGLLPLTAELRDQVARQTAGNPMFAAGLILDWAQQGWLVSSSTGFRLTEDARQQPPADPDGVWRARVERALSDLSAEAKTALQLGAVLGLRVDLAEWTAVCARAGIGVPVDRLDSLIRQYLLVDFGDGWAFAHGMIRSIILQDLRGGDRWEHHNLTCARMLQGIDMAPERIGRHLFAAGAYRESMASLLPGAIYRRSQGDLGGSDALFTLWEEASIRQPHPEDALDLGRIYSTRGRSALSRGELTLAEGCFERARREARQDPVVLSHVLVGESFQARARQDPEGSLALAGKALEIAMQQDAPKPRSLARTRYAMQLCDLSRLPESAPILRLALAEAQEAGDRQHIASCRRYLVSVETALGNGVQARHLLQESLSWCEASHDLFGLKNGWLALAELELEEGHLDAAEIAIERVAEYTREIGDDGWILVVLRRAELSLRRGAVQEAFDNLTGTIVALTPKGHLALHAAHVHRLAPAALLSRWEVWQESMAVLHGCPQETLGCARLLRLAAEAAERLGAHSQAAEAWTMTAAAYRALGRPAVADALLARVNPAP